MRRLLAILWAASVAELALGGAAMGLAGLAGGLSGWCDLAAAFAPVWLVISALGLALAWPALEPGTPRRIVVIAAVVGLAANALLIAPEYLRSADAGPPVATKTGPPLKLLTFNVWDDNRHPSLTVNTILASGADIVALQEVAGLSLDEQHRLAAVYPYWAPCPAGCDLALISKRPWTTAAQQTLVQAPVFFAIWAVTSAPDGRPVEVLTAHYLWPIPPGNQARQRAMLAKFVASLPTHDLIIAGDFNLAPWTSALRRQDADFAPLVRRTRAVFTWPATVARLDAPSPLPLLPIDQVYAGPAWRTLAVTRLARAGSDHYGVLVTLAR